MSKKFDFEVLSEMNTALEYASFGKKIISISFFNVLLWHILVEKLSYVQPPTIVCPSNYRKSKAKSFQNNRMSIKTIKNNRMSAKIIPLNNRMSLRQSLKANCSNAVKNLNLLFSLFKSKFFRLPCCKVSCHQEVRMTTEEVFFVFLNSGHTIVNGHTIVQLSAGVLSDP